VPNANNRRDFAFGVKSTAKELPVILLIYNEQYRVGIREYMSTNMDREVSGCECSHGAF